MMDEDKHSELCMWCYFNGDCPVWHCYEVLLKDYPADIIAQELRKELIVEGENGLFCAMYIDGSNVKGESG